ncbi:MAG: hypothetical protein Q4B58_02775 [Bacteroidales bacterium]|nr:hypothetical protein [Bacteroidales bacterium]
MNIILYRHRASKFGLDGILSIRNQKVCDTTEHPDLHLAVGTYRIVIATLPKLRRKVPFVVTPETFSQDYKSVIPSGKVLEKHHTSYVGMGHGPFNLRQSNILVGERRKADDRILRGVLFKSEDTFARLIDRLDKAQCRSEEIMLTICN